MSKKFSIAILASGNGSNAEAIIRYFKEHPSIGVGLILTNNPDSFVLKRAEQHGIPSRIFNKLEFRESVVVRDWLLEKRITHIVLAGFLWLIPDYLVKAYPDRIINIHPALLPRYGGKGMYGLNVHKAVRDAGDKETGITIHVVNEHYDEGKILFQTQCSLDPGCTAESIAEKVHALEYANYPRVIEEWIISSYPNFQSQ
jgi:phosphoribosylglycinamide formyltransferase-1